ncbi:MAG TPA: histidine phosphatase family protein [Allosphingosinicella sp.]|nr:histidine phosphatase family protein [Allosphingosinicella sp.]
MKTLTLLRHAKSGWDAPVARDFDRPLSPRGRKAARAMGREMKRLQLAFDRVIASPAARAAETIDGLEQDYGALPAEQDERVYLASAETLLDLVRATDDAEARLLIVGHNPGMEQLALLLAREGTLRDAIAAKYPTGALAEIRFEAQSWRDINAGAGCLEHFIRPRDLDSGLGPED